MKARELFIIILKVFGIYLIKDVLFSIPQVLNSLAALVSASSEIAIFSLLISLLAFGVYFLIAYILLFRTGQIVNRLKLTQELGEEPLLFTLHRSSVYTIAVIISGLLILVFAVPSLVREITTWLEYVKYRNSMFTPRGYEYSNLFEELATTLTGVLFLTYHNTIVNFIEAKRRKGVLPANSGKHINDSGGI